MGFWAQKKKSFITKKKLEDKKVKTLFIGILFPNFFWPTVRKNCTRDRIKTFEISRMKAKNLQKNWDL